MSAYARANKTTLRKRLMKRDGHMCNMCGRFFSNEVIPTIDHIQPLSKGGTDGMHNLQLLCQHCNNDLKKGHTPIGMLMADKGRQIMKAAPAGTNMKALWESNKWRFAF